MIYEFTISTPANTPQTAKQKTVLKLEAGMIDSLKVMFPPGPLGLLHLQILRGAYQAFPKSVGDFSGDNVLLDFPSPQFPLYDAPYELVALTWNEDDTYEHKVFIYLNISRIGVLIE